MNTYKDYIIVPAHTDDYDIYIINLSHEGILNFIEELEKEPLVQNSTGKLLVDQLLTTGNSKNRYLLCQYDHGIIDLDSAVNEEPHDSYRYKTVELLKENEHLLDNTILMDSERENIRNLISF